MAVSRNAPCPCGSGLRYKECHGKLAGAAPRIDELVARALDRHRQGRIDEAERIYRQVLAAQPGQPVATHFLGMAAWQRGEVATAEALMRESIARDGGVPDFHNNLGLLLRDTQRTDEALACFAKALEVDPGWFEAYNNRALTLEACGDWDGAIDAYRRAIECQPRFAAAQQNLARALLATGRFEEAWQRYRWRLPAQGLSSQPPDPEARELPADLEGRRFTLLGEQGVGDVLFFLRFVPELRRRGAAVAFQGDPRLAPLLARTGLFDASAEPGERVFVGDLPWLLQAHQPAEFPPLPLQADAARVARWRERLREWGPAPYVAFTWRAGVETVGGPVRVQSKIAAAELLAAAVAGERATWISVQRLPRAGERESLQEALSAPVHDASAANEDLDEMLALMAAVDDYAGVSNANTHLRAGVNGSMRVLVPHPPEWRWMAAGDRSPWFPSMRVIRQRRDGRWPLT
jgi:tetratricopeptide (TPR) repeat protein